MSKQENARRIEMLTLCGCSICGRRLIENGKPTKGLYVLEGAAISVRFGVHRA